MSAVSLVLNSRNVIGNNNNTFQYNFLNGSYTVPEGALMSISQITLPYSWFNISAVLGNNTFSYTVPTTASSTLTVTVTLADGFYQLSDLNNALSASLRTNGFYFYNSTAPIAVGVANIPSSQIIYPIQFVQDTVNYTNSIVLQYIPTSASNCAIQFGTGWNWAYAIIFGGSNYPTNAVLPSVTIPQQNGQNITASTYGIGNILGFTNGTYPPITIYQGLLSSLSSNTPSLALSSPVIIYGNTLRTVSYYSVIATVTFTIQGAYPTFAPLGSNVNGVIVRCNLVNNPVNAYSDVLDSFPITSTFGSNINYLPISDNWMKIAPGKYNSLVVTFMDQNFNTLQANDANALITLLIKMP